jgi:hypothetical protein
MNVEGRANPPPGCDVINSFTERERSYAWIRPPAKRRARQSDSRPIDGLPISAISKSARAIQKSRSASIELATAPIRCRRGSARCVITSPFAKSAACFAKGRMQSESPCRQCPSDHLVWMGRHTAIALNAYDVVLVSRDGAARVCQSYPGK